MTISPEKHHLLSTYPVVIEIPVLWGELDAYGHVNNTVYFRYFESARMAYLERCGVLESYERDRTGIILYSTECRFRSALHHPDIVLIGARTVQIEDDRFVMGYGAASVAQDRVVAEGITAIFELVNIPGEINCDLADVKRVMSIPGVAIMTTGWGEGPNAAEHAAEEVIFEPLLETHINGARGVLFTFSGGPDLTLGSVQRAASLISQHVDPRALIFFGMNLPREELTGQVKINLVATGIKQSADSSWYSGIRQNLRNAAAQAQPSKLTRLSMKYAPK